MSTEMNNNKGKDSHSLHTSQNEKIVAAHRQAALYLVKAAQYHLEAARCNNMGEFEKEKEAIHLARQALSRVNEIQGEFGSL